LVELTGLGTVQVLTAICGASAWEAGLRCGLCEFPLFTAPLC
jgi:hypothetical protein